jgi:tetratricopeptide (TPR) repeat protein
MYPHPGTSLPTWEVLGAAALLIAVTALAVRFGRRCPYLPVGWLWYLGTLVPVIGLIQVGKQAMANRYTYIPIIGLLMIAAWGVPELLNRRGEKQSQGKNGPASPAPSLSHSLILAILACLIVAAMTVASAIHIRHWRDSISLFEYTVSVTGNNPFSEGNLAWAYMEKEKYPQAIEHFKATLKMMPDAAEIHYGLGACYLAIGDAKNAVTEYSAALRILPSLEVARQGLGVAVQKLARSGGRGKSGSHPAVDHYNRAVRADQMGDTALAMSEYRQAISLRPGFAEAHCNLGILLKNQDKLDEAIEQYHEALKYNPGLAEVYVNLAVAQYMKGDYSQAWKELRQAKEYGITPSPDFVQALSEKMPEPSE